MAGKLIATPGQTVGPFFALGLDRPEWADMTRGKPQGQRITIEGQVLDGDGAPVPDASRSSFSSQCVATTRGDTDAPDGGHTGVSPATPPTRSSRGH